MVRLGSRLTRNSRGTQMSTERIATNNETGLLHRDLSRQIIHAFYQVHFELGAGHVESVYSNSMAILLMELGLNVEREVPLAVYFHGLIVGSFRADILVEKKIILELKAGSRLESNAQPQLLNYLRVTEIEVGLLLHFGPRATFQRCLMTNDRKVLRVSAVNSVHPV